MVLNAAEFAFQSWASQPFGRVASTLDCINEIGLKLTIVVT
jgi:hypothetical protein